MELDLFDPPGELRALRHASPRAAAALEAVAPKAAPALEPVPAAGPKITPCALTKWLPVASGVEIDIMAKREHLAITALGLDPLEAGHVADRLHLRDREQSGMTFCCECAHLRGTPGGWRCASLAGLPGALAGDVVHRLPQRCPGFDAAPGWPAPPAAAGADVAADEAPY